MPETHVPRFSRHPENAYPRSADARAGPQILLTEFRKVALKGPSGKLGRTEKKSGRWDAESAVAEEY